MRQKTKFDGEVGVEKRPVGYHHRSKGSVLGVSKLRN